MESILRIEFLDIDVISDYEKTKTIIVVNGVQDRESFCLLARKQSISVHVYDNYVCKTLISLTANQLAGYMCELNVSLDNKEDEFDQEIKLVLTPHSIYADSLNTTPFINLQIQPPTELWAKGYSINEFASEIGNILVEQGIDGVLYFQEDEDRDQWIWNDIRNR